MSLFKTIPFFPLAQYDIASVFTLPKNIYGRESIISEMTTIIEQSATLYRQLRIQNRIDTQHSSRSSNDCHTESTTDDSDYETKSTAKAGTKVLPSGSPNSSSKPHDGSDISSINSGTYGGNSKAGVTIVGLYGSAGTGTQTNDKLSLLSHNRGTILLS